MAFDAGSIEATLTLNRNPFTAGLAAARSQARGFENEKYEAQVGIRVNQRELLNAEAVMKRFARTYDATARVNVDRANFDRLVLDLNKFAGRIYTAELDLDTGAAMAQAAAFERQLRGLDNTTVNLSANTRAFGGAASDGFGSGASHFSRMFALIVAGAPVMASALGASVGVVGAFSSAMVIAGAGAGALALVAVPVFQQIQKAVAGGAAEIAKLPDGLRQAANAMTQMNAAYTTLIEQNRSLVAIGLATWFVAAREGLETLNPVVRQAAEGFGDAGIQAIRFMQGAQWQQFVTFLAGTLRPTINLMTEGIFAAVTSVMNLTEAFWNLGGSEIMGMVVRGMQDFALWTDTLGRNETFIRFMNAMITSLPIVGAFLREVLELVINLTIGLAPLGDAVLRVFTWLIDALNSLPPEWIGAIALGFTSMWAAIALGAGGPVGVAIGVLGGLAVLLTDLYNRNETFRTSVEGVGNYLSSAFLPIWNTITTNLETRALPVWERLVTLYRDNLQPVVERLADGFNTRVLPVLGQIADTLTGRLIPAIGEFLIAIEPFVTFFLETMGMLFVDAIDVFGRTFDEMLQGLSEGLAVWTAVFNGDWEGAWTHLKQMYQDIFIDPIPILFGDLWNQIRTTLTEEKDLLKLEWDAGWLAMRTTLEEEYRIWQEAWIGFWGGVRTTQEGEIIVVKSAWQTWLDEMGTALDEEIIIWKGLWSGLWVLFTTDQNREQPIIQTAFGAFLEGMKVSLTQWVADQALKWIEWWNGTKTTQNAEQPVIRTNWDVFWDGMKAWFTQWSIDLSNGWAQFWGGTIEQQNGNQATVTGSWNEFWTGVKARFDLFVADETAAMRTWWNDTVTMFREEGAILSGVMNDVVGAIGRAWDVLRGAMSGPVNWVIENVINRGIIDNWNTVMGWIGQPKLSAQRLGSVGGGVFNAQGQSTGNPAMGLARGGPIPYGIGVPGKDSVNAMLMPGEYVLSKRAVQAMGGLGYVDQMHRAAASSGATAAPTSGMPVATTQSIMSRVPNMDDIGRALFAYGGVMNHVAVAGDEVNRMFGPMAIGGKAARANASDHPLGLALDFMTGPPRGDRISEHLMANAQRLAVKYIIWLQRIRYPGGGWRGMADRGSPTANHMDHVHASFMARPGMVGTDPGGAGAVLTQVVSWWSQVGSRVASLLGGVNTDPPGTGAINDAAGNFGRGLMARALAALRAKLEALMTTITVGGGTDAAGGAPAGAGVQRWAPTVLAALARVGQPASLLQTVLRRMQQESGGNPNIANNWDVNAQRGDPSRGLMQVIGATFRAYRDPGLPNNVLDPMANIVASMRYAMARYGSLSTAYNRPGGYDQGGVLAPGTTLTHNATGRPEAVLTQPQWNAIMQGKAGASPEEIATLVRAVVTEMGSGDVINVQLPPRATVQELAETVDFQRRVRSKGRYSR